MSDFWFLSYLLSFFVGACMVAYGMDMLNRIKHDSKRVLEREVEYPNDSLKRVFWLIVGGFIAVVFGPVTLAVLAVIVAFFVLVFIGRFVHLVVTEVFSALIVSSRGLKR